jgi:oxygen-independent coproporphyrinogen-3 oxidase
MRRYVIQSLMCHFALDFTELWQRYGVQFNHHFAAILPQLQAMHEDGLLTVNGQVMQIQPAGRMLIRAICMVFDEYLNRTSRSYSKVI